MCTVRSHSEIESERRRAFHRLVGFCRLGVSNFLSNFLISQRRRNGTRPTNRLYAFPLSLHILAANRALRHRATTDGAHSLGRLMLYGKHSSSTFSAHTRRQHRTPVAEH